MRREPNPKPCSDSHQDTAPALSDRVLDRLWKAGNSEADVYLAADIRQAFIVVSLASRGAPQPFVTSSYTMYRIAPDLVWPKIIARRKAQLGEEFSDWYDAAGNLKPDI